jgi:phosphoribosylanthranilate isomerase
MNVFVKICGITNHDDALYSVESGANALGFVAWSRSPRYATPETVAEIIPCLPDGVSKVGVFVDADPDEIGRYVEVGINIVQLHGNESAKQAQEIASRFGTIIWRAIRPRTMEEMLDNVGYPADAFLIDAFSAKLPGGTGMTADWEIAGTAVEKLEKPVLLAGGLNPDNALEALMRVGPYGLDFGSGLESEPGRKDHAKIRKLFQSLGR